MNQSVVDELVAQRDFLLANTWTRWAPQEPGEGCVLGRSTHFVNSMRVEEWLGLEAQRYVRQSLGFRQLLGRCVVGEWNDNECQSAGEAIAVLDEAILLAKRDLA